MKVITRALISVAALAAFSAVQAEGLYIGGSLGNTRYRGPDIGGLDTDRTSSGGKIYGGYSFTPNFGLEAGYADVGKASSAADDIKGHGVFVDLVGTVPLSNSFSALARVGAFNGRTTTASGLSDSGTDAKYGLGVQYDFTKQAGIRGEWERYKFKAFGSKENADMVSVGLNYKF